MMAYDWFAVGAEAGFAPSQINLALLLRTDGLPDKGMLWLKQAEGHTDFGPAVERLKEKWWDSHANLSHDV